MPWKYGTWRGPGVRRGDAVARLGFTQYLARIVGVEPPAYMVEAMQWLWGEEAIRRTVHKRKSHRVRNFYGYVRRAFRSCDEVIGQELWIDNGQLSATAPYGHGHVYEAGIIKQADVVIVESNKGARSLAFEVVLVSGETRRNGRYVRRSEKTYVVQNLPREIRAQWKARRNGGNANGRGCSRNGSLWNTSTRRTADGLLRNAIGAEEIGSEMHKRHAGGVI